MNQRTDAEDAAQEALSYALLHPERFDPNRGRFSSWLYGIVVRICRNHLKRVRRRERLMFWTWGTRQRDAEPTTTHTPEDTAALQQMQGRIWDAVQTLPDLQKEALILRMWGGHTYVEIALILKCPQRTAQSRVRLAVDRLREHLGDANVWNNGEMIG
ncbi:MAG: sigma-70 family RNA polymerase sigma factor [Myxococcota bacterium]